MHDKLHGCGELTSMRSAIIISAVDMFVYVGWCFPPKGLLCGLSLRCDWKGIACGLFLALAMSAKLGYE